MGNNRFGRERLKVYKPATSTTAAQAYNDLLSEYGTASDQIAASSLISAAVSEALAASDAIYQGFLPGVYGFTSLLTASEGGGGALPPPIGYQSPLGLEEGGAGVVPPLGTALAESGAAADSLASVLVAAAALAEAGAATDAPTVVNGTFNIAALPLATPGGENWNGFMAAGGPSLARNTPWTDTTTAVLRRITSSAFPAVTNSYFGIGYATGGRDWSRRFNGNTNHLIYLVNGGAARCIDYQRGVGSLDATDFDLSSLFSGSRLAYCFSKKASEPHILYFATDGASAGANAAKIHRYDVVAKAYAPNAVFTGADASITIYGQYVFWMQQNWAGTAMAYHTTFSNGDTNAIGYIDIDTGVKYEYLGSGAAYNTTVNVTGATQANPCVVTCANTFQVGDYVSIDGCLGMTQINATGGVSAGGGVAGYYRVIARTPTSITLGTTGNTWANVDSTAWTAYTSGGTAHKVNNVNDIRICKGSKRVVALAGNARDKAFWFVDSLGAGNSGTVTAWTQSLEGYGHSDYGETNYYCARGDNYTAWQSVSEGTNPGEGGAFNGSSTTYYYPYSPVGTPIMTGDEHPNQGWIQTALKRYCTIDTDAVPDSVTQGAWTLQSGSIYQCTLTINNGYVAAHTTVDVVAVLTGANITGHLVQAASLGVMTAGSYFYNSATNTLYAWLSGGGNPTGLLRPMMLGLLGRKVGAWADDGSEVREFFHTYRNEDANSQLYGRLCFHTQSPEGDLVAFNTDMGVSNGRSDVFVAELPVN